LFLELTTPESRAVELAAREAEIDKASPTDAKNFAREQRGHVFLLCGSWMARSEYSPIRTRDLKCSDDLSATGSVFGDVRVFFGSSAIQADQRSRRILAVLSKGFRAANIFRIVNGNCVVLGVSVVHGIHSQLASGRFGFSEGAMWFGMLALWTACMLTASLTLLLSTFMPPLLRRSAPARWLASRRCSRCAETHSRNT